MLQQVSDRSFLALQSTSASDNFNAKGKRITNLSDPMDKRDAATLQSIYTEVGRLITSINAGTGANPTEVFPEWFGPVNSASIQTAVDVCPVGGAVVIGNAGNITLTTPILINKPCTISLGNCNLTSNLSTAQWIVTASDVSFIGVSAGTSYLTSTNTASGNIIQWGKIGETWLLNNLTVQRITFNLPQITGIADSYRQKLAGVASLANNINALSYIKNNLLVEDCIFNEGADQVCLEQTYHATLRNNKFNFNNPLGNGRAVTVWNSDYYNFNHNTLTDLAGTAANFNDTYHTGALGKSSDYGSISYNNITGTTYEAIQVRGNHTLASHNIITQAKGVGIAVSEDGTSTVHDNLVDNNIIQISGGGSGGMGIHVTTNTVTYPFNNTIASNNIEITANGTYGIVIGGGNGNKINNNNIQKASGATGSHDGIYVAGGGPALTSNLVKGFTRKGIYLNGGSDVKIMGNVTENNTEDGIMLVGVTRAFVSDNYSAGNGNWGIQVYVDCTGVQVPDTNRFYNNTGGTIAPALTTANADTSGLSLANLEIEVNQLKAALRDHQILAP